jgi:hypothetical protein
MDLPVLNPNQSRVTQTEYRIEATSWTLCKPSDISISR